MEINKNSLISDIVAQNYKTATIFKQHGIDFCCNGGRSLQEASEKKAIDVNEIITAINTINQNNGSENHNFDTWELDFMADYIYNQHHKYVEKQIPEIKTYLNKICSVHGASHPELFEIRELFSQGANELTKHMKKEELILFPLIKKLVNVSKGNSDVSIISNHTIQDPIAVMHHEHNNEGERFRQIAALSNNYTPPENACRSYQVAFSLLKDFEEDLHKHIHLENNILFKKAIHLENQLKPV